MAILQNPLALMQGDEQMTRYVAVLERRNVLLTIQEMRFRALLESLTGEPWDDQYTDLEQAEIDDLAANSLAKSLGITKAEAKAQVELHKRKANARNLTESDPNFQTTPPQNL